MASQESSEELAARFDSRAATYDDGEFHRALAVAVADFTDVANVHDLLDAATGTGLVLNALRRRLPSDARLVGVDLSPGMLEKARASVPCAELILGDATRLPFEDAAFDLVTCVTGIQLMPDAGVALREWARVLRPGRAMVVATFAAEFRWGHLVDLAVEAPAAGLEITRSIEWISPSDEKEQLVIAELTSTRAASAR